MKKLITLQINIVAESGQVKRLKRIYSWSRSEKTCHSSNTYCFSIKNTCEMVGINNSQQRWEKRIHSSNPHYGCIRITSEPIERIHNWMRSEEACHSSNLYCG